MVYKLELTQGKLLQHLDSSQRGKIYNIRTAQLKRLIGSYKKQIQNYGKGTIRMYKLLDKDGFVDYVQFIQSDFENTEEVLKFMNMKFHDKGYTIIRELPHKKIELSERS